MCKCAHFDTAKAKIKNVQRKQHIKHIKHSLLRCSQLLQNYDFFDDL